MSNDEYGASGRNHLILNGATMRAAMQLWVDTFVVGAGVVECVSAVDNGAFKVQINNKEEKT